ncbi:hypothetical protein BC831DRAFT_450858, partial [Entophlyctis helioformis]
MCRTVASPSLFPAISRSSPCRHAAPSASLSASCHPSLISTTLESRSLATSCCCCCQSMRLSMALSPYLTAACDAA